MKTALVALTLVCLLGCSRTPSAPAASGSPSTSSLSSSSSPLPVTPSAGANDAVQQKLLELSGTGAIDCGRHEIQAQNDELKKASDCALGAAKAKKAFYI